MAAPSPQQPAPNVALLCSCRRGMISQPCLGMVALSGLCSAWWIARRQGLCTLADAAPASQPMARVLDADFCSVF